MKRLVIIGFENKKYIKYSVSNKEVTKLISDTGVEITYIWRVIKNIKDHINIKLTRKYKSITIIF